MKNSSNLFYLKWPWRLASGEAPIQPWFTTRCVYVHPTEGELATLEKNHWPPSELEADPGEMLRPHLRYVVAGINLKTMIDLHAVAKILAQGRLTDYAIFDHREWTRDRVMAVAELLHPYVSYHAVGYDTDISKSTVFQIRPGVYALAGVNGVAKCQEP